MTTLIFRQWSKGNVMLKPSRSIVSRVVTRTSCSSSKLCFLHDSALLPELPNFQHTIFPKLKTVEHEWRKIEKQAIAFILQKFPELEHRVASITVHMTKSGTTVSFSFFIKIQPHLHPCVRSDASFSEILAELLTSLLRYELQHHHKKSWEDIEPLVDDLIMHSELSSLLSNSHTHYFCRECSATRFLGLRISHLS